MRLIEEMRTITERAINATLQQDRHTKRHLADQQRSQFGHPEIINLPVIPIAPVQNLDPTSPTFGQYYFILDLSPLGSGILG